MPTVFSFRAGLLYYSENDKRLYPDKTSGVVVIEDLQNQSGLVERYLNWYERDTGNSQDQYGLKIITRRTLFKFVDGSQSKIAFQKIGSQRTYELTIRCENQSTPIRIYFWMQDPNDKIDEEVEEFFNQVFLNKYSQGERIQQEGLISQLQQNNNSYRQGSGQLISAGDLASVLSKLSKGARGPPLHKILTIQAMSQMIDQNAQDFGQELKSYLPQEHQSVARSEIKALVSSPVFLQQLETFSIALKSQQLGLDQFGLNPKTSATMDVLESIQELVNKEMEQDNNFKMEDIEKQQ
eukprot:TRINITY_DN15742_c0_g2_i2.p1 TRINITY_DN15742_c0_g2~~TRINITY_DN15742_c0_g2_i2.p1  ORF type:complete len:319 (-),score=27.37 TRINITY_DN15742_c0_g2_i2:474-1358(-)